MIESLDHIVYCVANLPAGVKAVEALLGVKATPGGSHEGLGSENYLISLGPDCYLEIVGPDPKQEVKAQDLWLAAVERPLPAITTWAKRRSDLAELRAFVPDLVGAVADYSRKQPDGSELTWTLTKPERPMRYEGIVPFFIDWGETKHPSESLKDEGIRLLSLTAEHPNPERTMAALRRVGISLAVTPGEARLLVRLSKSDGVEVELS